MSGKSIDLLAKIKSEGKKQAWATAYDFRTAQLFDQAGIDVILVGDSLANVFLGLDNTYEIGMTEMLYHTSAVARGAKNTLLVADLPFGSYHKSSNEAFDNASSLIRAGAQAVKLEGATQNTIGIVKKLSEDGIPVIGHLGYTPQSSLTIGKGRIQGKTEDSAHKIIQEALRLEEAGAYAIVLELIPSELAEKITERLAIPTIGIGSGRFCDGQVLVSDDFLGKTDSQFKFLKKYANLSEEISRAVKEYARDVRESLFPE